MAKTVSDSTRGPGREASTAATTALSPWVGAIALGSAAGVLAGLIDGAIALLAGFKGDRIAFMAYAVALAGTVGAGFGGAVGAWSKLRGVLLLRYPAFAKRWTATALAGFPLLLFAWWVPSEWVAERWPELSFGRRAVTVFVYLVLPFFVYGMTWVLARARVWAGRHTAARWALVASALALAAASYLADRTILVGLYEQFHYGLAGGFALSLAWMLALVAGLGAVQELLRRLSISGSAMVLAGLLTTCIALEMVRPNVYGLSESLVFSKLINSARAYSDFDGDGSSAHFGSEDCDNWDASVGPGKFDFPGNGVDEDCDGSEPTWPPQLPDDPYPVVERNGYNVLLVTIDALRADHVGCYGYGRATTPVIDALAARSLVFENAYAQASKTLMSIPSLISGIYPSNLPRNYEHPGLEGQRPGAFYIGEEVPVLAELFQKKGYRTVGFVRFGVIGGLYRGFDDFRLKTKGIAKAALSAAKQVKEPFFMWAHYGFPHDPYEKHEGFDFGDSALDRYDSEIAWSDKQVGELLEVLRRRKLLDKTIVVITADHGEEFGEHGGKYHRSLLHHELLHVPLIVFVPGLESRRVLPIVELVDIAPTLAESLGLAAGPEEFDGQSLWATLAGKRGKSQTGAYAEIFETRGAITKKSLYDGRWRANWDLEDGKLRLFDKTIDAQETSDVAQRHGAVAAEFEARIATRSWRRASVAFREYARSRDVIRFAPHLGAIQQQAMLDAVLEILAREPQLPNELRSPLERVLSRSTLERSQRTRVQQLLQRIQAGSGRLSRRW